MNSPSKILHKYWGYPDFRTPQLEIIETVLKGRDSMVLLPTGGGKSICYQIPALLSEGICIVISPLIALIQDQVENLQKKNIKAIALTSQLNNEQVITAFDNLQYGDFKFLYLSPEKLQSPLIQEKIKQLQVSIIAIDEAHCISEWGHDFRPAYLKLKLLRDLHPNSTTIALTATATSKVFEDIQFQLGLNNARFFKKSFQRSNLSYNVLSTENIYTKILQIVTKIKEPIIIYTNSRKTTKDVQLFLKKYDFNSCIYHGGLSTIEKKSSFTSWMENKTPIMIATNAFGMGIDKPNVRAVIHINPPNSIENFIQEAGRAGRDNIKSYSIIITNKSTIFQSSNQFTNNLATPSIVKNVYHYLNQYYRVALGELPTNLFDFSLYEFINTYKLNYIQTYNAVKFLERENILCLDENYRKNSTLKIVVSNSKLFEYLQTKTSFSDLIKTILRSYGGIFDHFIKINEYSLSKKLKCSKNQIIEQLKQLHKQEIVNYSYQNTTSKLSFLIPRDDKHTIHYISKSINQQNKIKLQKHAAVISYLENKEDCRNTQLLAYFNEVPLKPCGICDNCLAKKNIKTSNKEVIKAILQLISKNPCSSKEIEFHLNFSVDAILESLKLLLEENKITITSQNKFKLNN